MSQWFLCYSLYCCCFISAYSFHTIWACMEANRRNKPSISIKALLVFWSSAKGNKSNAKKARFLPYRNLTGTIYYWSVILRSLSVAMKSAKREAVLLLSSHLLISRHPVQKSTFGACAVTGYCSFNTALSRENLTAPTANILLFLYWGLDFWTWLNCADASGITLLFNDNH